MEGLNESCDFGDVDWSQESTITVAAAAADGIKSAIDELAKRDKILGL